jgi:serine/threonine protein kinase
MDLGMSASLDMAAAAAEICQPRGLEFVGDLGKGAFKSAFLVRGGGREYALKVAIASGSADRLARECDALRGCSHPGIATLVETFAADIHGHPVWVTLEEYVPGGTLEAALSSGVMDPSRVRQLALGLADVLAHLAGRRLVHRDIKPANILFAADGFSPVLTDFGVVRMLDQPSLTRDFLGFGPGTPAYAAPEQLNNDKTLIDWRTDQFGLAVVLSQCLTGRHPFMVAGASLQDAVIAVASRKDVPSLTSDALRAMDFGELLPSLKPWPVDRYRRPQDLINALTR